MAPLQLSDKSPLSSASDSSSSRRSTRHARNASASRSKHVYGLVMMSCLVLLGTVRAQGTGPNGAAAGPDPLTQEYCSTVLTAENTEPYFSTYQTLGLCKTHCGGNYAFAVVKGNDCWCSNVVPDHQDDVNKNCNVTCPGFPDNLCGGKNHYGYMALAGQDPSSTVGVTPVRTSDTDDDTTSTTTTTSTRTAPTESPSESSPTSATDQTPSPVISVVTLAGSTHTITMAPSAGYGAGMTSGIETPKQDFFSSTGRVVGVFVVVAIAIMALVVFFIWLFMRRRRQQSRYGGTQTPDSLGSSNGESRGGGVEGAAGNPKRKSRSMSTLGLVGAFNSEKQIPTIATTPATTGGGPSSTMLNQPERLTDQRLDPHQVWLRFEQGENASRVSVRSLRDDHDYSRRVLRLTNPDGDI